MNRDDVEAWLQRAQQRLTAIGMRGLDRASDASDQVTRGRVKATGGLFALALTMFWIVQYSVTTAGIVNTIIYLVLFITTLTITPLMITFLGASTPGRKLLAKGHVVLGAVAYKYHYLVQRDDQWEWQPGTSASVLIDGEEHAIPSGVTNRSVLGWRPFGVLRYKTPGVFQRARVDTKAERERDRGASADGGAVTRGGFREDPQPGVSGIDGMWVVDLKRLMTRGVRRIGDIEIIETAEEIVERGQVDDARIEGWKPIIGAVVGLIIGVIVGYAVIVAG